jgi:hypothetical protein
MASPRPDLSLSPNALSPVAPATPLPIQTKRTLAVSEGSQSPYSPSNIVVDISTDQMSTDLISMLIAQPGLDTTDISNTEVTTWLDAYLWPLPREARFDFLLRTIDQAMDKRDEVGQLAATLFTYITQKQLWASRYTSEAEFRQSLYPITPVLTSASRASRQTANAIATIETCWQRPLLQCFPQHMPAKLSRNVLVSLARLAQSAPYETAYLWLREALEARLAAWQHTRYTITRTTGPHSAHNCFTTDDIRKAYQRLDLENGALRTLASVASLAQSPSPSPAVSSSTYPATAHVTPEQQPVGSSTPATLQPATWQDRRVRKKVYREANKLAGQEDVQLEQAIVLRQLVEGGNKEASTQDADEILKVHSSYSQQAVLISA